MSSSGHQRLERVDAARGIAASSVTVSLFQIGAGLAHATHLTCLGWIGRPGSSAAVPLFFVVSAVSVGMTAIVGRHGNLVGFCFVLNVFFGWCTGAAVAAGYHRGDFSFLHRAGGWQAWRSLPFT